MDGIVQFFQSLTDLMRHNALWTPLAIVLTVALLGGMWIGRNLFPKATIIVNAGNASPPPPPEPNGDSVNTQCSTETLLKRARDAVSPTGPGLWLSIDPVPPLRYKSSLRSSIPIYTIANLKGGVGKTTIAAGLAAHYANPHRASNRKSERVLLIDLDFQGSLSSMALTLKNRIPNDAGISRATQLISATTNADELFHMHQRVKGLDSLPYGQQTELYAVPAYYDLAQAENRLMVEWLINDINSDIRYNLAELLLSKQVQKQYDRIIIDAPPRLTTAHVQALSGSTHVLIPTILDQLSGEAVGSFIEQLVIHVRLWPHLKVLGVVGSMTKWGQDKDLQTHEKDGAIAISKALEQKKDEHALMAMPTEILPRSCFIPDISELGRAAGSRIGYLDPTLKSKDVRDSFDRLAAQLKKAAANARELEELVRS